MTSSIPSMVLTSSLQNDEFLVSKKYDQLWYIFWLLKIPKNFIRVKQRVHISMELYNVIHKWPRSQNKLIKRSFRSFQYILKWSSKKSFFLSIDKQWRLFYFQQKNIKGFNSAMRSQFFLSTSIYLYSELYIILKVCDA